MNPDGGLVRPLIDALLQRNDREDASLHALSARMGQAALAAAHRGAYARRRLDEPDAGVRRV